MAGSYSTNSSKIIIGGARTSGVAEANQVEMHQWSGSAQYTKALRADTEIANTMVSLAKEICLNNYFLYSQDNRSTGYAKLKEVNWDVKKVDTVVYLDCSSFVATCVKYAGIKLNIQKLQNLGLFCTKDDQVPALLGTGYFTVARDKVMKPGDFAGLKAGDILWRYGHTEIVISIDGTTYDSENYGGGASSEQDYGSSGYRTETKTVNTSATIRNYSYSVEFETRTVEYEARVFRSGNQSEDLQNTGLLTYPTLVEVPFIQLKVGTYTFGTYKQVSSDKVQYPNYIQSMTIDKTNGQVNEYTITLIHQIEAGADPNIVDKVLSSISNTRLVYISYGDYNSPSFTYKEEQALLISSSSSTDFTNSRVTYTLKCTSNATQLYARLFNFEKCENVAPSAVINRMLWNCGNKYGLLDAFPGMSNATVATKFISNDDQPVTIEAKTGMDPISYINYLVSCMCSSSDNPTDILKSATYKLALFDTTLGAPDGVNGAYFKIVKVTTSSGQQATISSDDIYEVDVGYPSDNMVTSFTVNEDETWSLLYSYSSDIVEPVYNLTPDGDLSKTYYPKLALSKSKNKMTEEQKTWWTNMTRFPVSATLVLKGLIRPAILMSYVRINAYFYGQRHISSGLYFITSQKDTINSSGYRTELGLQRIMSDDDYLVTVKKTKTEVVPKGYIVTCKETTITGSHEVTEEYGEPSGYSSDEYGSEYGGEATNRLSDGIYQKNPYQGDPEHAGLGSDPSYVSLAICAAFYALAKSTDALLMSWATSAVQNRIEDLRLSGKLGSDVTFYKYIHCNKTVINNYNNPSHPKYNKVLYAKYKDLTQYSTIFTDTAIYAFDAMLASCEEAGQPRYNYQLTYTNGTVKHTIPGISQKSANAVAEVLNSGTRYTTANYFSLNWKKLVCGSNTIEGVSKITSSAKMVVSGAGTDEQQYNINTAYWILGETELTSANSVSCIYVGFPNNNTTFPAFGVEKSIIKTTSSSSSSSSSSADERTIWCDLRKAGLTAAGAAGLMGNILREGGLTPTTVEGSFCRELIASGVFPEEKEPYPNIGRAMTNFMDASTVDKEKLLLRKAWCQSKATYWGYGMVQWTTPIGRKEGLIAAAKSLGVSVGTYAAQFKWLLTELTGDYAHVLKVLKSTNNVNEATEKVYYDYEGPSKSDTSLDARKEKANEMYSKYKNVQ